MPSPQDQRPTVLISGCSSGIGLACALGLQQRGWRVFAGLRSVADADPLHAAGIEVVLLDLDDARSIDDAVAEVSAATGGQLAGLFNNAGFGQPGAVEDLDRETLRAQFETNVFGTHQLTCRVLPLMRRQGAGRVVFNSSVLGFAALPYRGAYNASKFALEGLVDTLRMELIDSGITVSLIEPGPIATRFRERARQQFHARIDAVNSAHRDIYQALERRLTGTDTAGAAFTLPAESIIKPLIHALEARRPRPRYYVTLPTHAFGLLRRLLSTRMMDAVLLRSTASERR